MSISRRLPSRSLSFLGSMVNIRTVNRNVALRYFDSDALAPRDGALADLTVETHLKQQSGDTMCHTKDRQRISLVITVSMQVVNDFTSVPLPKVRVSPPCVSVCLRFLLAGL